jgi:UDP-glucose 4-epimerase
MDTMSTIKENNMEKVLVTGGAGFIGYHTVEKLIEQGYDVTVFDNMSTGKMKNLFHKNAEVKFILGDLRNENEVENALKGMNYVIHLGASLSVPESMLKPELYQAVNVQGTFNVLYFAQKQGIKRIVLASTCAVEGDSFYGLSKLITEQIAHWFEVTHGLKTVCLRYVNVFGERQRQAGAEGAVVPAFINTLLKYESPIIHGDGSQTRDYVYVKDVADANVHALTCEYTGISYVATGEETSVITLLLNIADIMKRDIHPIHVARRDGDMMSVGCHLPNKKFGWISKYTLQQGLQNYINNFS